MGAVLRQRLNRFPRRTLFLGFAVLFALAAAWPLLRGDGLLNTRGGGDSPFLLQRVQQLVVALGDGHFPVRWMPDAAYGYGYPFFHYYAPLSVYIAALFHLFGFAYVAAIKLAQLLGFVVAALAVFLLAERWFRNRWAALLASVAYTLAPFHLINIYVRGDSLAEFWAMALYPLVFLGVERLADAVDRGEDADTKEPAKGGPLLLVVSYGALVLTHNISALIFSPFLLLYILMLGWSLPRRRLAFLARSGGALLLALALAAWFWVPALAETDLVQTGPVTAGYFHYSNHFRSGDLVQPSFLFDYDVAGLGAFRMGAVQTALLGAAVIAAFALLLRNARESRQRAALRFGLVALALATLMITPASRFLWDTLPLLPYVQFPWRFLSVQAFAGALLAGALIALPWRRLVVIGSSLLLLVAMLGGLTTDFLPLAADDVTAQRLAEYEWFTGNIGTTVSAEYLPRTVQPRFFTSPWLEAGERNRAQVLAGEATLRLEQRQATRQVWHATVVETSTIEFPTLYWEGWQAAADDEPHAIAPAPGSGLISLTLPPGEHVVTLMLGATPLRRAAELTSLLALLALVGLLALRVVSRLRQEGPRARASVGRTIGAVGAALFLFFLLGHLWPAQTYRDETMTWDFAQEAYLHHRPDGVPFSNAALLEGYTYSAEMVTAGEGLQVSLHWVGATDTAVEVALMTPAVHRYAQAEPVVAETLPMQKGAVRYDLRLPPDVPPGLYVPRVRVADAEPLTASGEPRGDLFLRPVRVAAVTEAVALSGSLEVKANAVTLVGEPPQVTPDAGGLFDCAAATSSSAGLLLHLSWWTKIPLSHNYVVSLRLTDDAGGALVQCDVQPGYGFLPSGSWPAGVWVPDRLTLPLPAQLPPAPGYTLLATVYAPDGPVVLRRRLGELLWQDETVIFRETRPRFELPEHVQGETARFGDVATLRGYELTTTVDALALTFYWQALEATGQDFVRFVHLVGSDGRNVAQVDSMPQNNTYPTSQWQPQEIVVDTVLLDLAAVPPGTYQVAVGFYPEADPSARVPAYAAGGQPLADNRLLLSPTVTTTRP